MRRYNIGQGSNTPDSPQCTRITDQYTKFAPALGGPTRSGFLQPEFVLKSCTSCEERYDEFNGVLDNLMPNLNHQPKELEWVIPTMNNLLNIQVSLDVFRKG